MRPDPLRLVEPEQGCSPRTGIRPCHARHCHDVEPEKRSKPNRKRYHARETVRNRSIVFGQSLATCPQNSFAGFGTWGKFRAVFSDEPEISKSTSGTYP